MLRAVRQENKEKIETLIENCGDVNAASSTLGNTILMYSTESGNVEIVNLLIEKGGLISESFSILRKMCQISEQSKPTYNIGNRAETFFQKPIFPLVFPLHGRVYVLKNMIFNTDLQK